MNLFSLKNGFWLTLALMVALASSFDFITVQQSALTDSARQMIDLSYKIIDESNKVSRDFERLQQNSEKKTPAQQESIAHRLQTHISNLKTIIITNPAQQAEVERLSNLLTKSGSSPEFTGFSENQEESIRQSLLKIDETEESLLKGYLRSNLIQNKKNRQLALWASLSDILLLCFIAYIWIIDFRKRHHTEQTLSEAIHSISKANFELEQANLSKTHLLKTTAHDLRNPLGSIRSLADLISKDPSHATVLEMTGIIRQVSMQTLELVNSLIDSKALTTGKPENHFSDFDMVKCIENICLSQRPLALEKNQTLHFNHDEEALIMKGVTEKIWDLFMNLVGNAIKFSPLGGDIYLRLRKDLDFIYVEVEDQGPGFTDDDKNKAFQRYQRLSAQPTGGESSTGLGLSLVKEIVDLHHGNIEIQNNHSGKGACFLVTLPISPLVTINFNSSPTVGV